MTLTEFLLARVAEDEADARLAVRCHEPGEPWGWDTVPGDGLHIARWDPARVLAECEAKRRIVELHTVDGTVRLRSTDEKVYVCRTCSLEDEPPSGPMEWPCDTLRALAAVYADHPDYRDEWKP